MDSQANPRIAFVTEHDARDVHAWSGSVHAMATHLVQAGARLEFVDRVRSPLRHLLRVKQFAYRRLLARGYLPGRDRLVARDLARRARRALRSIGHDVVLSPGTIPVAHLTGGKPVVIWTDATFDGLVGFYDEFSNLPRETLRAGHALEQSALDNCALAIYTSQWAADTALRHYRIDEGKIAVVPFGANVGAGRSAEQVRGFMVRREAWACRLLFVGVDWQRKGGDVALAVTARLREAGVAAELHVVGCTPPGAVPAHVIVHGFVSKRSADGRARLAALYANSHFLILPTRADCVPVVFAEASSYGLPSLATRVGGVTSAIREGVNGYTFDTVADSSAYAERIRQVIAEPATYRQLCLSSFAEYADRLNWGASARCVLSLINERCLLR